jgi:hypothetical protein
MPIIHAPLSDEDFVDLAIMAREKGMTRSALASYILIAAIRKDGRAHEQKIQTMSKDGTPRIPMYERQ